MNLTSTSTTLHLNFTADLRPQQIIHALAPSDTQSEASFSIRSSLRPTISNLTSRPFTDATVAKIESNGAQQK
jgi:hypothetical protein